jgi:hypothetical protein
VRIAVLKFVSKSCENVNMKFCLPYFVHQEAIDLFMVEIMHMRNKFDVDNTHLACSTSTPTHLLTHDLVLIIS